MTSQTQAPQTLAPKLFTGPLMTAAMRDAFIKLDPRLLMRNPVMFVTAMVATLSTILWVRGLATGTSQSAFEGQLVFWLWLTVLFGNLAEAIAELGTRPVGIVMGAEGPGLRDKTRDTCDRLVKIPAAGGFASLNVSNAAAVALYVATQR